MENNKTYLNWEGLVTYTKEFKEWVWKLFRKVHARIGHVEEELAKVKENTKVDYEIVHTVLEGNSIYTLIEETTQTEHGKIVFDSSSGILPIIWTDKYED